MKQPRTWCSLVLLTAIAAVFAFAVGCISNPDSSVKPKKVVHDDAGTFTVLTEDGAVTFDDASSFVLPPEDAGVDGAPTLFPIGGQVTGLTGAGLVLQNNVGDTLPVPANGAFVFPTFLPAGAAYSVNVATQPTNPTQVCKVTAGAYGAVAGPVTSIVVTCTTQAYPVGGQVVGLASTDAGAPSTGLVLTNTNALVDGGTDQLPIDQNGSFAFPTLVASGSTYSIGIASQPTFPAQTCTVSGGTGTVVSGAVNSAVVNCATNAYIVSGSVGGLTGSGLVLANGTNTATISANGSFAFAQPLMSGTPYNITVATQPTSPSQTCVVTNGTGVVQAGNITGVSIACTTNSFSIGGNVANLAGSGLVLASATGDTLAVSANGAFTFPTAVTSGAPFAVTVKTQPKNPWQVCSVTGGSGTVGNGPVANVAVSCQTSAFSVGGDVAGLSGTGLSLTLNGGSALSVTGNGAFTFPATVPSGAAYQVKIASQPSGPTQTCSLSGGSGTVAGGAISVSVSCTTNTYAIGGTVLGLTGTGLTLTDNGGGTLVVPSGATSFTFGTSVASGASYLVAISSQPTGPSQTCSVSAGSGTVVSSAVSGIIVNCGTNSFTVGGSVANLAGSGLVLANGAATVAVGSNGSFAFGTPVTSGTTYDVTVKTQPTTPSQTCTVTNPTGTVGSGNVTMVSVSCTTNSFAVGGNLSGLSGTGLVLADDTTDQLPVTANGSFTFAKAVESGTPYAVTVATQPTSPWQTCSVTGGSGTMGNAALSSVGVTCNTNTYAVGGSVKGLASGDSVSLSLNSGTALTVSANTSFTFPTTVASGATYKVVVTKQPASPAQTCTVSAPTGTIAGGAVSNVTVSCTTNSYAIGGQISGLTGSGLKLVNGSDTLTIAAGATSFTFPTRVLSGASYNVQIPAGDQPTSPTQACTVSGGNGTVGSAAVTSVAINCNTSTFSIGGTVSQLAGSGLVLVNGTQTVAISANGSFAFPTAVASGAAYDVKVQTQPTSPTQSCAVSSGSGTVTNGNVGGVQVTCTTTAFTVSVTVSGLSGSGLVLTDNGTDTLPVPSNGTYSFPTSVLSGSSYAVGISTQPTSPWQSCAVFETGTAGSGTVGNGPVSGIVIGCNTSYFTIGGSVSNLSGSGLTLTVNGGDTLSVSSSGAFTFSGSFASGTGYTVATAGQPGAPTQSCTIVAGATGTVQGSNVVSVDVDCSTLPFTIAGQIFGLAGSGLVLTDNGGDKITVPAGATSFTFPTQVLSGDGYDVEVAANPSGPTQVCSPSSNAGTVGAGDVSGVVIDCSTSSFTISGTVSGLTGSGMVLSDGAGQTLGVSGSTFSFVEQSGTAYDVTVSTQPTSPWETCTLTSGVPSGTIMSTSVSGLVFTCTPNTYTVSGTISGLAGSGFEINDGDGHVIGYNAATRLTVPSFSETLPSGASYNFTAYANPTSPWQTCTATTGGTGSVTNANISGIVFTCTTNTYTVTANMVEATGDLYMYDEVNSASYYYSTYMENGSYTFPPEASGSTYNIAVYSPPAYQTCSVYSGNGSGTLTNANVTVDLYCATTYYLLTIDVTNTCESDITVYSGYEGGSIGSIASSGSVQPESFSEPGGSTYSVSASGPGCLCGFSGTTSGTMTGNVTLSLSCEENIQ